MLQSYDKFLNKLKSSSSIFLFASDNSIIEKVCLSLLASKKYNKMRRITIGSRVSTEAWRFDDSKCKNVMDRWSYGKFGDNWQNARVFGKVVGSLGQKLQIQWDIDNEIIAFEKDWLFKEDDNVPVESLNKTHVEEGIFCQDSLVWL